MYEFNEANFGQIVANSPALSLSNSSVGSVGLKSLLQGRYSLDAEIGCGGMGKVFKAYDFKTGRFCAIKLMHSHLRDEPLSLKRFEREARISLELRHDNIVRVADFGFTPSREPYFVMEFLQGMSLADLLEIDKVISEERFVSIFSQVCLGLSYAHGRKVVHRDMKPSNVMLVGKGNVEIVKLVDFGIARVCSRTGELCSSTLADLSLLSDNIDQMSYESKEKIQKLTQPGEIFGSPLYMSPEQCLGDEADCVSEVYSLGCMMFEALVGSAPLRGRTAMDTLVKRVNQKAPSINSLDVQLKFTESIELLVAKCLERDRSQRFQTVDAVYDALQSMKMD